MFRTRVLVVLAAALAGKPELKGVSKDRLRKALEAAADKSKAPRTKRRAEEFLRATK